VVVVGMAGIPLKNCHTLGTNQTSKRAVDREAREGKERKRHKKIR